MENSLNINNFISVRFSIMVMPKWREIAYGPEENRAGWIQMRAHLFQHTLHASVMRQTVLPKGLFLLMDAGDREIFERIFPDGLPLVVPVYESGGGREHFNKTSEYIGRTGLDNVALSRVDSDDVIGDLYLENINAAIRKRHIEGTHFDYLVATHGYRSDGVEIQKIYYSCSPFLTVFRADWEDTNIYAFNHEDVLSRDTVSVSDAVWLQYIHGTNVSNAFVKSDLDLGSFERAILESPKVVATQKYPLSTFVPKDILVPAPKRGAG